MTHEKLPCLITVVGTTASGKSTLGIELARHFSGEVVSADSRQIYKGLDLGTGKVTPEETEGIPHHLIDIIEPNIPFSLAEYQALAYDAIDGIISHGKVPFLVGGTGLYTRAVADGYSLLDVPPDDEFRKAAEKKSRNELLGMLEEYGICVTDGQISSRRLIRMLEKARAGYTEEQENCPRYSVLQLGLTYEREVLNQRIEQRLDARIEQGMIDEVRRLSDRGAEPSFLEGLGLEYRYTYRYIAGMYPSYEGYRTELLTEIKRFAKRQITWFSKDKNIIWLDTSSEILPQAVRLCSDFLSRDPGSDGENI